VIGVRTVIGLGMRSPPDVEDPLISNAQETESCDASAEQRLAAFSPCIRRHYLGEWSPTTLALHSDFLPGGCQWRAPSWSHEAVRAVSLGRLPLPERDGLRRRLVPLPGLPRVQASRQRLGS